MTVPTMPDLDSRSAIHDLVVRFYREVVFDDLLGPVFGEVAEVDWSVHLPKLVDYWCRVLLGQPGYDGFVLGAHQHLCPRRLLVAHAVHFCQPVPDWHTPPFDPADIRVKPR